MSFGDGDLHVQVDRLKVLNGELCAEVNEKDKRIRELESLVRDTRNALYFLYNIRNDKLSAERMDDIDRRIRELGIEV